MNTVTRRSVLATLAASGFAPHAAHAADTWPNKPLRIVVPYPPGGSSDIIARAISQPLGEALKTTVIVDNRPGANGNTGTDAVAKSTDGHTLLLCDVGALAITPSVYAQLPFDPSKDLRGVTMLAYSPHLLVVHPSVPANTLQELVALSHRQKLNFAVTAMGSAPHLAGVAVAAGHQGRLAVHPVQRRLAGHRRHRGRPDASADERHAGHAAAGAGGQAEGHRCLEGHARAAAVAGAHAGRTGASRASSPAPGRAC